MTQTGAKTDRSEWRIAVNAGETTALFEPGANVSDTVFVCAHGAGGQMNDKGMTALAKALTSHRLGVVRFNFLYTAKGSSRPDPMPRLEECFSAVVARVRQELAPRRLIIGGRSMGGRAGSMMASKGFACDGLLLFAYPLHPAGHPEKLRDAHLPAIQVPVLCFNGTRDSMCTPALMETALKTVATRWDMHWLEGADHGFHVPRSSGRTDADVLGEVAAATSKWIDTLQ